MNELQKITLLITMAVVTWKVCRIESITRKSNIDLKKIKSFEIPKEPDNANDSARRLLKQYRSIVSKRRNTNVQVFK